MVTCQYESSCLHNGVLSPDGIHDFDGSVDLLPNNTASFEFWHKILSQVLESTPSPTIGNNHHHIPQLSDSSDVVVRIMQALVTFLQK